MLSDEVSLRELKHNRINLLNQNITLACIKDGTEEIVGLNIVGIVTKDDSTKPHGVYNSLEKWHQIANLY